MSQTRTKTHTHSSKSWKKTHDIRLTTHTHLLKLQKLLSQLIFDIAGFNSEETHTIRVVKISQS